MSQNTKSTRLVWIDLEMTGLDVEREVIVEIATIITEADLTIVAEGPDLVISAEDWRLDSMAEVVTDMHTSSGLMPEIRASTCTVAEAEAQTLAFVKEHCPTERCYPLCGNSIGTDRRFIARYMPYLDAHLHYRSVDVSSIKELARRWYPGPFARAPKKGKGHRALADIRESIAELAYWRGAVFRPAN